MIFFSYVTSRCAFHDWLLKSRARVLIGSNASCCSLVKVIFLASSKRGENQFFGNNFRSKVFPMERRMGSQGAMRGTVILTNFEFSSTIIGKVSHLSGGFSG